MESFVRSNVNRWTSGIFFNKYFPVVDVLEFVVHKCAMYIIPECPVF